jgi:hypothetical protein
VAVPAPTNVRSKHNQPGGYEDTCLAAKRRHIASTDDGADGVCDEPGGTWLPLGACCCSLGDSGLPTTHWSQAEPCATVVQCTRFPRCSGLACSSSSAKRSADGVSMFTFTPRADRYSAMALPILLVAPVRNTWDARGWRNRVS